MVKELEKARKDVDLNPSDAQKKAENYKMGHVKINGFYITIENPKGSYRSGTDSNGKKWKVFMHNDYGYFTKTVGKDGDAIDVFIGPNLKSEKIFAIDQKINGKFDETKIMFCFSNAEQAKKAYLSNYEDDWKGFWKITEVNLKTFKAWLYDGHRQYKPFFDYLEFKKIVLKESIEEYPYYLEVMEDYGAWQIFEMFEKKENPWLPLINPSMYQKALDEFMKFGQLTKFPTRYIYQWMFTIVKNICILNTTTEIAGHSQGWCLDEFVDYFFQGDYDKWEEFKQEHDNDDDYDAATWYLDEIGFYDWCKLPDGSHAWSDYGLPQFSPIIGQFSKKKTPEEILVLINRCLDVAHPRGDLASMFIEGGSKTLSQISNGAYISEDIKKKLTLTLTEGSWGYSPKDSDTYLDKAAIHAEYLKKELIKGLKDEYNCYAYMGMTNELLKCDIWKETNITDLTKAFETTYNKLKNSNNEDGWTNWAKFLSHLESTKEEFDKLTEKEDKTMKITEDKLNGIIKKAILKEMSSNGYTNIDALNYLTDAYSTLQGLMQTSRENRMEISECMTNIRNAVTILRNNR